MTSLTIQPKPSTPNQPINNIYLYKKSYQAHVRKLSQIRNIRKSSLQSNNYYRNMQIQQIKDVKYHNFVYKLNQQAHKICQDNLRLFQKLQKEKSKVKANSNNNHGNSARAGSANTLKRQFGNTSNFIKMQKQKNIQKQNKRLRQRIKSSQSYISSGRLKQSQMKRQQIRSRIRKFNDNQQLKSQRYFTVLSARVKKDNETIYNATSKINQSISDVGGKKQSIKNEQGQRKVRSFYHHKDIIKNKIQNFGIKFKSFKKIGKQQQQQQQKKAYRLFTPNYHSSKRADGSTLQPKYKSFFATQAQ